MGSTQATPLEGDAFARDDWRRWLAEGVGVFVLVFIGPGAAAVDAWSNGGVTHVGVALAFGCVILALVATLGQISGAHLNPAVTLAFGAARRLPVRDVAPYILAQLTGAALAGLVLRSVLGAAASAAVTRPAIGGGATALVEMILTLILMLVILAVATDARLEGPVAGLAIGATVAGDALMGGPLTGASMNPARSFGPALATGVWDSHWAYWAGPIAGALLAVALYQLLRKGALDAAR